MKCIVILFLLLFCNLYSISSDKSGYLYTRPLEQLSYIDYTLDTMIYNVYRNNAFFIPIYNLPTIPLYNIYSNIRFIRVTNKINRNIKEFYKENDRNTINVIITNFKFGDKFNLTGNTIIDGKLNFIELTDEEKNHYWVNKDNYLYEDEWTVYKDANYLEYLCNVNSYSNIISYIKNSDNLLVTSRYINYYIINSLLDNNDTNILFIYLNKITNYQNEGIKELIYSGKQQAIKDILKIQTNYNGQDLRYAVIKGNIDIAGLIITFWLKHKDEDKPSNLLFLAIISKNLNMLNFLSKNISELNYNASIYTGDGQYETLLEFSLEYKVDIKIIEYLLKKGAKGENSLWYAGKNHDLMELLIKYKLKFSPGILISAVEDNDLQFVKYLIEKAKVDPGEIESGESDLTAMDYALEKGNKAIIKYLRSKGGKTDKEQEKK